MCHSYHKGKFGFCRSGEAIAKDLDEVPDSLYAEAQCVVLHPLGRCLQETGGAGVAALDVTPPEYPLSAIGVFQLATVQVTTLTPSLAKQLAQGHIAFNLGFAILFRASVVGDRVSTCCRDSRHGIRKLPR